MSSELTACRICGQVHELAEIPLGYQAECARCGSRLKRNTVASLHLTAAFSLCALLLYFPANLFPILRMNTYGNETENTIFTGVVRFYQDGDYFIAVVVFLASMLVPFLKILGLFFIVVLTHFDSKMAKPLRIKVYKVIDAIGRWAMLDVFALAILISLLKLEGFANVIAGKGVFAFVLVIVFTLMASFSFDPHLIWEGKSKHDS